MFTNTGKMGKAGRTLRALAVGALTASLVALAAPFSAGLASADGNTGTDPGAGTVRMLDATLIFEGGTESGAFRPSEIVLARDGEVLMVLNKMIGPDGQFSLDMSGHKDGTYTLWVKTSRFLAAQADVKFAQGYGKADLSMIAGDADSNNVITAVDFSIIHNSMNRPKGDPKYDERADFNYDGKVDKADMELLMGKNGKAGAPKP